MQKVNAEYSNRIAYVFDSTIAALRNDKGGYGTNNELGLKIASQFELLKSQVSDILSYTFEQEQDLRSDVRRFNCETSTKSDELAKLETRLVAIREEQKERQTELKLELSQLKKNLDAKIDKLMKEQDNEMEKNAEMERSDDRKFSLEMSQLKAQKDELLKLLGKQKEILSKEQTELRDANSALALELSVTTSRNEALISTKKKEVEGLQNIIEQQKKRRIELEEYFARVDRNKEAETLEEEALQRFADIAKKAQELLDNGAAQMQKLYRGVRDRALFRQRKKSSKKNSKSKKGGKKN